MAAFGSIAVPASFKRGRKSTVPGVNAVSQIVFSFQLQASDTVAGPIDIVGAKLPPGSVILGGVVSPSQSMATATLAFKTKTANVVFSAATAYTAEASLVNSIPIAVPSSATADDQIQVSLATASAPATLTTVTVTLFVGHFGAEVGRAASVGN
jgi:hypothetical protein